ncbi:AAA family ATPase, partial [Nodosilinea sp. PGN35]|uniref:AAA family ATPase n=1 Tax=Nodosilinea sp. PGN35 TaxID=3020489 RepID=UPI00398B801E
MASIDRTKLLKTLTALPQQQFSQVEFALKPPNGMMPGITAPLGDRALALLNWAESPTGPGLAPVQAAANSLLLPTALTSPTLGPEQTRPVLDQWYGREQELGQLATWLADPAVRLVEIVGLGGFGKSSLAARWLESTPNTAGQVWVNFSVVYSFSVFALWLLQQLGPAVDESTDKATLMRLLVERLSAQPSLVVLDNLETLTADAAFADYRQFLTGWLEQGTTSQIVLTSREQPDLPANLRRQRCKTLPLQGLSPVAATALLRGEGVQGTEAELQAFATLTDGHPLLLNLIVGQLWDEYGDTPPLSQWQTLNPDLFAYLGAHRGDPEASVGKVFAASYNRLTPPLQQLLRYLSVYRPRFDPAMALAMAEGELANEPSFEKATLRYLVRLALLQEQPPTAQGRRYFLLPLISQYLERQGDLAPAHQRAVAFYQAVCKPNLSRTDGPAEVAPYLELAHHLCELGQFGQAMDVLQGNTDSDDRYSSPEFILKYRTGSTLVKDTGQDQSPRSKNGHAILLDFFQQIATEWQPETLHQRRRYGDTLQAQGDVLQFLDQRSEALA